MWKLKELWKSGVKSLQFRPPDGAGGGLGSMSDSFRQGSGSGGARATWIGLLRSTCLCASCLERETFWGHGDFPHLLSLQRKFSSVHAWRLDFSQSAVYAEVCRYGFLASLSNISLFLLSNSFLLFFLAVHSSPIHSCLRTPLCALILSGSFIVLGVCGVPFSKGCVENPISLSLTPIKTPICPRGWGILWSWGSLGGFIRVLPWVACYRGPLGRDVACLTREHTHACSAAGFQCRSAGTKRPLCVWRAGKGSLMVCDQRVMSSCGVALVFFVPDVEGHTQCAFVMEQPWLCLTGKWECLTLKKCINVNKHIHFRGFKYRFTVKAMQ